MSDFETTNFFTDTAVHDDPYAYFDHLHARAPVWQEPHYGVYMVTGYDEAHHRLQGHRHFSSCNTVERPIHQVLRPVDGDDITEIIEEHRDEPAVQRPAAVVRPADAHRPPRPCSCGS